MRSDSLVRALRLLRELEGGKRVKLNDVARRYAVNYRTIRRDFEALSAAGYPVCNADSGGEWGEWWIAQ